MLCTFKLRLSTFRVLIVKNCPHAGVINNEHNPTKTLQVTETSNRFVIGSMCAVFC